MKHRTEITNYEEAVEYLLDIPRFNGKNTMEDTKAFLQKLGNPDKKLRIIHVAGTNGKGSVCAYLRYILEEAGYTTAVFTSPHLVDIRERFLIKGEWVSREAFLDAFWQVSDMLEENGYHPSFFEYLFFMAMLLFVGANPDYCILETGLGGRLDATNAVSKKELAVITRIGQDHTEYLGDTLEQIAGEKAGIMKQGAPVIFTDFDRGISDVFCRRAKHLGVRAYPVSKKDYAFLNFNNKSIDFSLHSEYYGYIRLTLHTQARYQMENAALAVRAVEVLNPERGISADRLKSGIGKCFWQGRMEEILPEVYVDGAHNADGVRAFIETVAQDGWQGERILLFGVVKDKDYRNMAAQLADSGLFQHIALVSPEIGRGLGVEELYRIMIHCFESGEAAKTGCASYRRVRDALEDLIGRQQKNQRIYIAGSLYLVGEVKELVKYD
ncbi:MAG: bifunctional folylpolyglutamate synthase/dihydrofolate synthase [Roseburia sp.]|nr:bifunctional folylpolyglutamate synthase/dihydrofolate synthase [Roseburia sp.]